MQTEPLHIKKPVDISAFIAAVKWLGIFWSAVNEPPLGSVPDDGQRQAGLTLLDVEQAPL